MPASSGRAPALVLFPTATPHQRCLPTRSGIGAQTSDHLELTRPAVIRLIHTVGPHNSSLFSPHVDAAGRHVYTVEVSASL
ncbi:hypothetical protein KC344_g83 [Hortaea werneckii]|nr:hypothetical protein KC344_g83 [Hortaea werneckii]